MAKYAGVYHFASCLSSFEFHQRSDERKSDHFMRTEDDPEFITISRTQFKALRIIERDTQIPIEVQLMQALLMWSRVTAKKSDKRMRK